MRRRRLLASIWALGTAGCTVSPAGEGSAGAATSSATDAATPTTTPRGGERRVALTDVDDVPAEAAVDLSVDLLRERITAERTASLRIRFRNAADETRRIGFGVRRPFTTMRSDDDRWLLLENPDFQPVSATCWEPPPDVTVGHPLKLVYAKLDPDETVVGEYELWGNGNDDACMPVGEVRFAQTYQLYEWPVGDFEWGFGLSITAP